ncbi:MAG: baseplate J/gp47 family protein [Polyangiales bacterium]
MLLRYQSGTDLDESAEDDGTARKGATYARRDVAVVGPPSASSAVAGATLSTPGGLRFRPINPSTGATLASIDTDGSGDATIAVECLTAGVAGNLAPGVILTWSSAPTGFAATGEVASGPSARAGEDIEGDDDLRNRLLLRRVERPGGGNRSWWWSEAKTCAGVGEAFVYRVMDSPESPPGSGLHLYLPNKRGNITVMPFAPPPSSYEEGGDGMAAGFSRAPSTELVSLVHGYFHGENDENGSPIGAYGAERFPAHMFPEGFHVVPPRSYERDVVVSVQAEVGWRWLPGDNAVDNSGTSTATVLVLDLPITGWQRGDRIAIEDWGTGATRIRGGWFLRQITDLNAGSRSVTLNAALPGIPPAGTATRPDAVNVTSTASLWATAREDMARVFDEMGPGPGPSQTFRFPDVARDGRLSDLTRAAVLRTILNVAGVADGAVTTPAASEVAPVGGYFVLRDFRVERMV